MKLVNIILIIVGIIFFITSFIGGGYWFHVPIPFYSNFAWLIGVALVALGLWLNEKDKKAK
jgi:hypothetical protein